MTKNLKIQNNQNKNKKGKVKRNKTTLNHKTKQF